jgi:hypothetical protein
MQRSGQRLIDLTEFSGTKGRNSPWKTGSSAKGGYERKLIMEMNPGIRSRGAIYVVVLPPWAVAVFPSNIIHIVARLLNHGGR